MTELDGGGGGGKLFCPPYRIGSQNTPYKLGSKSVLLPNEKVYGHRNLNSKQIRKLVKERSINIPNSQLHL